MGRVLPSLPHPETLVSLVSPSFNLLTWGWITPSKPTSKFLGFQSGGWRKKTLSIFEDRSYNFSRSGCRRSLVIQTKQIWVICRLPPGKLNVSSIGLSPTHAGQGASWGVWATSGNSWEESVSVMSNYSLASSLCCLLGVEIWLWCVSTQNDRMN